MSTQGRYGAVNTIRPKMLRRVSGFRRDQMYTRVDDSGCPRNGIETSGERTRRNAMEYKSSHEKWAGDRPDDSSRSREYRCWK